MPPSISTRFILTSFFFFLWTKNEVYSASITYSGSLLDAEDALQTSSLSIHQQRHLQAIGGCPFEDLVSFRDTCSISDYCKTTSPSTLIECGGDLTNRWTIRLEERRPRCYNDPNNRAVFFFPEGSTSLPEGGVCSRTILTFQFINGNVLSSVESNEVFTAPEQYSGKTFRSVRSVQACNGSGADWATFGSQAYCNVQCPTELVVDGESCQVACLPCGNDGRQSFSCPNFYPFFRFNCFDAEPQNIYREVLAKLDPPEATDFPTLAPTRAPVPAPTPRPTPRPTRAPVSRPTSFPTRSPTRSPTQPPRTPAPTTPLATMTPTETPTLPVTTTNPTPVPTFLPTSTEIPTRSSSSSTPSIQATDEPTGLVSEAPSEIETFFVDGPIQLSPVFFSSDATTWSTHLGCTLMAWLMCMML